MNKIYKKGNYLIIDDSTDRRESLISNVQVDYNELNDDFVIYYKSGLNNLVVYVNISNLVDETDTPYTISSWIDFYTNLGIVSGGGAGYASAANQTTQIGLETTIRNNTNTLSANSTTDGFNVVPKAKKSAFYPHYKGVESTDKTEINIDSGGALVTRGAVTTDEGTFRANFANTSIDVALGVVSILGKSVVGSGFLSKDVNFHDYIKLDSDPESSWAQIDRVIDDTTIVLTVNYVGGTSGNSSRSLVVPITQTGGSYSVSNGQLTIVSGTTTNGGVIIGRVMDYGPLVYRTRLSISQRVLNNETRIGFVEPVTVTPPRWTARFIAEGTVNNVIKCESSRNPTGTPSVSETELTTVSIPNGLNTSQMLEYRIEQLTESVRFYISGILVAEHSKTMPAQSDIMVASIRSFNTGVPASSTNVIVDYLTVKNHNKLEIGIMSDAEKILSASVPLQPFNYSVAGVIPINTDLIVLDCSQLRSLFIQCNSIGTSGVVAAQWSNEPTFAQPITATLLSESGATSTTFNGAVMRVANVMARYCRLRLITATTAGTTTLNVWGAQFPYTPIVSTQPVSGTVTANIGTGSLAAGTNAIGDLGLQYRANATGASTRFHLISAATTNLTNIKNTAGRLVGYSISNTNAAWRYLKFHNLATAPTAGASVFLTIGIPPNGVRELAIDGGVGFTTGIAISTVTGSADADTTAVAVGDLIIDIFFA
jgi:hypothetical protein